MASSHQQSHTRNHLVESMLFAIMKYTTRIWPQGWFQDLMVWHLSCNTLRTETQSNAMWTSLVYTSLASLEQHLAPNVGGVMGEPLLHRGLTDDAAHNKLLKHVTPSWFTSGSTALATISC